MADNPINYRPFSYRHPHLAEFGRAAAQIAAQKAAQHATRAGVKKISELTSLEDIIANLPVATHTAKPPAPRVFKEVVRGPMGRPVPVLHTQVVPHSHDPTWADRLALPGLNMEPEVTLHPMQRAYRSDFERTPVIRKTLVHEGQLGHWRNTLAQPSPVRNVIEQVMSELPNGLLRNKNIEDRLTQRFQVISGIKPSSPAMKKSIDEAFARWRSDLVDYVTSVENSAD